MTAIGYSPIVDTILDQIGTKIDFTETDRETQVLILALLDQIGANKEAQALCVAMEWDELPTA
jgi:hypothetical protein